MDTSYETDFVAWTAHQAKLLHQHRAPLEAWGVDVTNLAEEVQCLGAANIVSWKTAC
jgi:Domain of unknown function DUF29